jgi:hypothetical protein
MEETMKRFISVCLFILCLSFPALGGHTMPGGWCNTPCCYGCIPDEGEQCAPCQQSVNDSPVTDAQPVNSSNDSIPDFGPEVMLGLLVLLMLLRINRA